MSGKYPDYLLMIKEKGGPGRTRAGAAWKNEGGGVSIVLNPGVVLDSDLCKHHVITLWPHKKGEVGPEDDLPF